MPNKINFGKIAKNLNIQGVVDNVKSIVSPDGGLPIPDSDDELGNMLVELSVLAKEAEGEAELLSKKLLRISQIHIQLFREVEAMRGVAVEGLNTDDSDADNSEDEDDDDA